MLTKVLITSLGLFARKSERGARQLTAGIRYVGDVRTGSCVDGLRFPIRICIILDFRLLQRVNGLILIYK